MSELGELLRNWRDRVSPEAAGLSKGAGRRAPGLRREELAALAGLSVDYVVRLEQGRSNAPSAQVVGALARALRLDDDERDHLYQVAGFAAPMTGTLQRHVPARVQRIVDRLGDTPVSVYSAAWDLLLFNPLWSALLGDLSDGSGRAPNLARLWFTSQHSQVLFDADAREAFSGDLAAELHAASARYANDHELARLISELRAESAAFEALWGKASIRPHRESRKTITHPTVGPITLDSDVLTLPDIDLRLVIYTTVPGTADADRLELLKVTGLQQFAAR